MEPQQETPSSIHTYTAERIIGNGSFGVVYKAHAMETNEQVAIKKVYQDKRYKNREFQIMKTLSHQNIVQLKHAFYTSGNKQDELFLNLVMEYIPETVHRMIKYYSAKFTRLPLLYIKVYSFQLARALAYLHALQYSHRDIKPHNLLVNPLTHELKLCDFGSAKKMFPNEPNVSYICSRYYRAPELIFGNTFYSCEIDIWSFACVLAEMFLGKPLFRAMGGTEQLIAIVRILGSPKGEDVIKLNPSFGSFTFPEINAVGLYSVFPRDTPPQAIDLLSALLRYDPGERLPMMKVLAHPFFDELREESTCLPDTFGPLPPLFNFSAVEIECAREMDPGLLDRIVPQWYYRRYGVNGNRSHNPNLSNLSPKLEAHSFFVDNELPEDLD